MGASDKKVEDVASLFHHIASSYFFFKDIKIPYFFSKMLINDQVPKPVERVRTGRPFEHTFPAGLSVQDIVEAMFETHQSGHMVSADKTVEGIPCTAKDAFCTPSCWVHSHKGNTFFMMTSKKTHNEPETVIQFSYLPSNGITQIMKKKSRNI